jgi:hypothetical protein
MRDFAAAVLRHPTDEASAQRSAGERDTAILISVLRRVVRGKRFRAAEADWEQALAIHAFFHEPLRNRQRAPPAELLVGRCGGVAAVRVRVPFDAQQRDVSFSVRKSLTTPSAFSLCGNNLSLRSAKMTGSLSFSSLFSMM